MFFCSRPENPLFPGRSRVMPAPVLPGHPGLYAKDRAPDRRTMGKNRAAPLQERQLSPVRHATHGRGPTGLSGMAQRAARRGR